MTFSDSVRTCLREKYVTFSGRASRSEYWWFALFTILVTLAFVLAFSLVVGLGTLAAPGFPQLGAAGIILAVLFCIFFIGMILPTISVTVRRFHDYNLSGWWYLAAFIVSLIPPETIPLIGYAASLVIFVITVLKGTDGPNKFGPDPLRGGEAEIFA
ncbi:DUF805 domain-containing protein [Aliiroseovarius sp. YM-037]|uniref:DUF805 domain-containing protein n=1 Tax=Aliiroseovarius sp. YM-037 TaxID=3341728 RepID=UPI003A80EE15